MFKLIRIRSFGTASQYAVGTNPAAVIAGDFNNDGKTDFAAANAPSGLSGSVSILLNGAGNSIASLQILEPNHAPSGTDKTYISINEDSSYTFSAADFGFSDADGNAFLAVKISSLPANGLLKLNGAAIASNAIVNVADINAGHLTLTPNANYNGYNALNVSFQVQDNGGTANGGVDLDATPNTIGFSVTSINDLPTGTVTLSGIAAPGHTLTVSNSLADADGLGVISYNWQASNDGVHWSSITRAFGSSLLLTQAELNQQIRVQASYYDGSFTFESQFSVASSNVIVNTLVAFGTHDSDVFTASVDSDRINGGFGFDTFKETGASWNYGVTVSGNSLVLTDKTSGVQDTLTDIERVTFDSGSNLFIAHSESEAVAQHLISTWLHRDITNAEGVYVQQNLAHTSANDLAKVFLTLLEASGLQFLTHI